VVGASSSGSSSCQHALCAEGNQVGGVGADDLLRPLLQHVGQRVRHLDLLGAIQRLAVHGAAWRRGSCSGGDGGGLSVAVARVAPTGSRRTGSSGLNPTNYTSNNSSSSGIRTNSCSSRLTAAASSIASNKQRQESSSSVPLARHPTKKNISTGATPPTMKSPGFLSPATPPSLQNQVIHKQQLQ